MVFAAAMAACSRPVPVENLPAVEETMAAVGRRLSRVLSAEELGVLATRGDLLLGRLIRGERAALARGACRFHVDHAVVLDVAAPSGSIPFWLDDLGFRRLPRSSALEVAGCDWVLYRKRFNAGWIGLGVNGLDRTPKGHYVVFVRPVEAGPPLRLTGLDSRSWRIETARDRASAAFDLDQPIGRLPEELCGALLIQPAHARRHASLLAPSRVWKTHVASRSQPDQITVAFGSDPAHSLVWTWRTDPGVTATRVRLLRPEANEGCVGEPRAVTLAGRSQLIESPGLLNDPVIRRHRAAAADLEPDTVYAYSAGDGSPAL
jgi:hypothetical protein